MYVDTHLHLDEPWLTNSEKRQKVIDDITVNRIITFAQSCDLISYDKILEWSKQSDYLFPSFGILPWFANEYMDRLDEVADLCENAIMLGEIGLDLASSRNKSNKKEQLALLDVFLKAAEKHDMVLNLHFRGGIEPEGFEVLKSYNVKRAIFHWYSGTLELMDVKSRPKWATHVRVMWATHVRVMWATLNKRTVFRKTVETCLKK
jgi:TatD DNase family protein